MKIIDINGMEREVTSVLPDQKYPGFMKVMFKSHHEWYSIQEFLKFNPKLKKLTDNAPKIPDDVVGIVTSAGKDYLRDSSQKWEENAYLGIWVWISRGKGEAQKRIVIKNTHNQLTVDKPWKTIPNKTSQYVISYNIGDVKAFGNTLPASDMEDFERKAVKMDKQNGKLSSQRLEKTLKYLKPDEV